MVKVVPPGTSYLGASYGEWLKRWFEWLCSLNPDQNNNGPVVYDRGVDFGQTGGGYHSFVRAGTIGANSRYIISDKQAIMAISIAYFIDDYHHPNDDNPQKRLIELQRNMRFGVTPSPLSITLDGQPLVPSQRELERHEITSNDFQLVVPNPTYGQSVAPDLDEPFNDPVTCYCVVGAYAFLIEPLQARTTPYVLVSRGDGEMGYITETFLEILVQPSDTLRTSLKPSPASLKVRETNLITRLKEMATNDKSIKTDLPRFEKCVRTVFRPK